mmetsp:Transcript_41559/g.110821  ORF Transcript_41559/g.110821 Transcript_41559/m.110821 type:complete len:164 (+) Transcript_41559:184-675(+)
MASQQPNRMTSRMGSTDEEKGLMHARILQASAEELCGMGFDPVKVRRALQKTDGDVRSALDLLIDYEDFGDTLSAEPAEPRRLSAAQFGSLARRGSFRRQRAHANGHRFACGATSRVDPERWRLAQGRVRSGAGGAAGSAAGLEAARSDDRIPVRWSGGDGEL